MRSDDDVFVTRCLEGDQPAFAFLVDKYKEVVHAYAYHKVGDYQQAEDITQEVFIKAYGKLAQLKWPHRFRSWLYTIVSNECKLWLRRHSKEREQEVSWEDLPSKHLDELAVRAHSDEEIKLTVKSAMETLSDDRQLALSLYYMSSLSIKEIAYFMGVSPNSVKIKLHRARKQLGERLEKMIGKQLRKEKLKSGFILKVVDSMRDMPIPSLPKPRPIKWAPIPISIGTALLIGIIGFGVSSGRDVPQDMPLLKPMETTYEVSLLPELDKQAVLDTKTVGNELVALNSGDDVAAEAGRSSNTGVTVRRVCEASPATDAWGAPSPDGRYMSFAGWKAANLMVRDLTTGKDRYLTDEGTWDDASQFAEHSVWSPDGKQIAYIWYNNGHYQLRIVGLDGLEPRVLISNENRELGYVRPYEWSRDGKSILVYLKYKDFVARPNGPHEIALVSVADGSVRVLKSFEKPFARIKISLSPDGRYVVYSKWTGNDDIFLLATDGGGATPLVEHPAQDLVPIWTPDGKAIVFVSDRSGTPDLWLLQVTGGKPVGEPMLVKRSIGWILPMGFTQDGSLYYGFEVGGENVYVATLDPSTGRLLSPPTKAIQKFEGFNYSSAWSPDGKYLAYASARRVFPGNYYGSYSVLVIRSVETGEERELRAVSCDKRNLYWSPDGHSIVCRLKMVDAQTGDVTTIIQERVKEQKTALSPDGKTFFYNTKKRIAAKDLETGEEQELCRQETQSDLEYWYGLAISSDGRHLAFSSHRSLKVMPAAGGEPRELLHLNDPENFFWRPGLLWTPDGRYILFVKSKSSPDQQPLLYADQPRELWRIPAEGGEPQKLLTMHGLRTISIHPDGRLIAFTGESPGAGEEIWVMENFLPGFTAAR